MSSILRPFGMKIAYFFGKKQSKRSQNRADKFVTPESLFTVGCDKSTSAILRPFLNKNCLIFQQKNSPKGREIALVDLSHPTLKQS